MGWLYWIPSTVLIKMSCVTLDPMVCHLKLMKFHYVAPQFLIFGRTVQIAPNFLHWSTHIFLLGLILRDTPNSIIPQTTLCLLPIPVRLLVLPCTRQCKQSPPPPTHLFSCPGQRNRQSPVPVPVTGVRYNSLLWMCTLNTLIWPDS